MGRGPTSPRRSHSPPRAHRRRHKEERSRSRSRSRDNHRGRARRRSRSRSKNRSTTQSQSLLVRNVPLDTTVDDLREAFGRSGGDIRDVYIPRDYHSNEPRGFAFVEFFDSREARDAKFSMDRTTFHGQELAVLFAKQRRKTPGEMRSPPQRRSRSRSSSPRPRRSRDDRVGNQEDA